ncbi:MAG TPA: PhaM family polyhydroxyalkanoate granule multifunctional regulatory protein [Burkholderiales bacterium]|nr:PhaM family polyhydroxyalkanoate granule multifunctional regulatory protein [Burkholderiales bacterium]
MPQSKSDAPASSGAGAFSTEDALAFLTKMWNPLGLPVPGLAMPPGAPAMAAPAGAGMGVGIGLPSPASMFATLDPAEIERKIGELRVIENWLQMSLNFMQMSIKTMELQKASLEALRASTSGPAGSSSREEGKSRPTQRKKSSK